jgi:hypothetical protein
MLVRDWWLFEADQSWALQTPKEKWDLPYEFLQDLLVESSRVRHQNGLRADPLRGHVSAVSQVGDVLKAALFRCSSASMTCFFPDVIAAFPPPLVRSQSIATHRFGGL